MRKVITVSVLLGLMLLTVLVLVLNAFAAVSNERLAGPVFTAYESFTSMTAVSMTIAQDSDFELLEVRMVKSAAADEDDLAIKIDSQFGSTYDFSFFPAAGDSSTSNVQWLPTRPIIVDDDDQVVITYPNTTSKTVTVQAQYRVLDN